MRNSRTAPYTTEVLLFTTILAGSEILFISDRNRMARDLEVVSHGHSVASVEKWWRSGG